MRHRALDPCFHAGLSGGSETVHNCMLDLFLWVLAVYKAFPRQWTSMDSTAPDSIQMIRCVNLCTTPSDGKRTCQTGWEQSRLSKKQSLVSSHLIYILNTKHVMSHTGEDVIFCEFEAPIFISERDMFIVMILEVNSKKESNVTGKKVKTTFKQQQQWKQTRKLDFKAQQEGSSGAKGTHRGYTGYTVVTWDKGEIHRGPFLALAGFVHGVRGNNKGNNTTTDEPWWTHVVNAM